MNLSDDERAMLQEAIEKSEKLLAELLAQQEELDRNPPKIPQADLIAGRQAMQNAIASARRTVQALHDAEKVAQQSELH